MSNIIALAEQKLINKACENKKIISTSTCIFKMVSRSLLLSVVMNYGLVLVSEVIL